jgi:hypothetical protein
VMFPVATTSSCRGRPREQVTVAEVLILRHHDAAVGVCAVRDLAAVETVPIGQPFASSSSVYFAALAITKAGSTSSSPPRQGTDLTRHSTGRAAVRSDRDSQETGRP